MAIDNDGIDIDALQRLANRTKLRAAYVTPHHQYPTTVTLKAARRLALLALARAEQMAIIEDDYDHEFQYDGRPVLPLASADRAGHVVYIGTLSKILAPGLRIGYMVAPPAVLRSAVAIRSLLDIQGDLATEVAVATLIEDGELQRHVARVRRVYANRREILANCLRCLETTLSSLSPPAEWRFGSVCACPATSRSGRTAASSMASPGTPVGDTPSTASQSRLRDSAAWLNEREPLETQMQDLAGPIF